MVNSTLGIEALPLPSREPNPTLREMEQAILNLGQALNQGDVMEQNLGTWSGEFRNAYETELRAIATVVKDLQTGLSNAETAFRTYSEGKFDTLKRDIEVKQGEWDQALSDYYSEKDRIEEQWEQAKALTRSSPGN